ncbi:hypothetical protein ACHAQA_001259 [Verticillium albo-atrum]
MPPVPIYTSSPITAAKASGTQNLSSGPPAPQPGAVPTASGLPPPPKTGETYHPPQQTPAPQATTPYPPQMSIPPPTTSYAASYGASTATTTAPGYPQPAGPTPLPFADNDRLAHPPGYQQNPSAADFSSNQRAAHTASVRESGPLDGSEEGVWESAKKWASTAGDNIAAAETEIWRRINKS